MKTAEIVIGLGFGDEGKGVVTDFLSFLYPNAIVIRFSGGQQAGHTVIRNGIKHIHSSYGSGTLQGIPTYLTEDTTFCLTSINLERESLKNKGINPPLIQVHPLAKITTPYDIAFNQFKESLNQHGSCGKGVGATMHRNLTSPYKLYACDLSNIEIIKLKLKAINTYYIELISKIVANNPASIHLFDEHFNIEMNYFLHHCFNYRNLLKVEALDPNKYNHAIFEGSQGVMLDMDHGIFPNVTYANTTSKNALKLCKEWGVNPQIWYVSRCYQTRHGNGPMTSNISVNLINTEHEINVKNNYQGEFRTAELDYDLLNTAIAFDSAYSEGINKRLVVTCLDQRPGFLFDKRRIDKRVTHFHGNNSAEAGHIHGLN